MLRGPVGRRDDEEFRAGAASRLLGAGHGVPTGGLRLAVPDTDCDEARRHQN